MDKRGKMGLMLVWGLIIAMTLVTTGCTAGRSESTDSDSEQQKVYDNVVYKLYNKIEINEKKADIEKTLGATGNTSPEGSYVYVDQDTGYAVNVFFNAKNLVTLKLLVPTTGARELIELSKASVTREDAEKITPGMTRSNVRKALNGVGVEMLRMVIPDGANKEAYALAWININGSILVVTFDADTDTVLAAEFRDSLL
jgi:hypothetical protein